MALLVRTISELGLNQLFDKQFNDFNDFDDFSIFRPSHQSLKSRDRGQNAPEDMTGRDFRRELEDRERVAAIAKGMLNF